MKHTEVIERLCNLHSEAAGHIGYEFAADCFCGNGGFWHVEGYNPERDYRNDGRALQFIEAAVREKIERESSIQANAKVEARDQ
jgi:hypothetical protein